MKILIVGPSWVGDAVMAQSLYKIIKDSNPQSKIDVLSPEWSLGILNRMDELDDLICSPFDHGDLRIKDRIRFGYSLRDRSYDQAIVLPNSFKSSLVPYLGEIPIRTGWRGEMRYFLINDMRIFDKNLWNCFHSIRFFQHLFHFAFFKSNINFFKWNIFFI